MSVVSALLAIESFDSSDEFLEFSDGNDNHSSTMVEDDNDSESEVNDSSVDSRDKPINSGDSPSVLTDSGFGDIDTESLGLDVKCLKCILEWPSKDAHAQCDEAECKCDVIPDHMGFEEYVDDIFLHRLSIEEKYHAPSALDNQPELSPSIRSSLVKWMTTVNHEFKLTLDTLCLSVNILDRLLNVMQVARDCIELLGITCLLLASKQNEIFPPEINELLGKCSQQYSRWQVTQLEIIVLMATSFDLVAPTAQQFLEYYASYCLKEATEEEETTTRLKWTRAVCRCLLELSLQHYQFCQFKPSLLALCIWKAAQGYLNTSDGDYFPPDIMFQFCSSILSIDISLEDVLEYVSNDISLDRIKHN